MSRHSNRPLPKLQLTNIFHDLCSLFVHISRKPVLHLPPSVDPNKTALVRILAGLFELLGLTTGAVPGRIPRALHRTILRVLRPTESAVRRLIVIVAGTLKVKALPPRAWPVGLVRAAQRKPRLSFQLFDPRQRFFRNPPRPENEPRPQPRITFFGHGEVHRISLGREPPPSDGLETSTNIVRRLEALKAALDDLPRQAKRMARALARRQQSPRLKFQSPLRPGAAPGSRKRPLREIDHVLERCHWLARAALAPDTS